MVRRWEKTVSDSWHKDAACAQPDDVYDPDPAIRAARYHERASLFDPVGEKEPEPHALRRARIAATTFCRTCPVRVECAAEAEVHEYLGVWSGNLIQRRATISLLD